MFCFATLCDSLCVSSQIMELFRESRENIAAGTFNEWSEKRLEELK